MTTILSDHAPERYTDIIARALDDLHDMPVSCIALVAICADGERLTAHWKGLGEDTFDEYLWDDVMNFGEEEDSDGGVFSGDEVM